MQWWYWILVGIALIIMELMIPAFFVLWFGLGALITGVLVLIVPVLPLPAQIFIWALSSAVMTVLWFRLFPRIPSKTRIGTADGDIIGEIGLLTGDVSQFQRGSVRFQRPILGSEEWLCIADMDIAAGSRVKIQSAEGSFLKITRI